MKNSARLANMIESMARQLNAIGRGEIETIDAAQAEELGKAMLQTAKEAREAREAELRKRDEQELLELAYDMLDTKYCLGRHLVVSGYVCGRCGSQDPSSICFKEKVRDAQVILADYPKPEREKVARFAVIGKS